MPIHATQLIAGHLYVASALLAVACPFLPMRLLWRCAALTGLAATAAWLIEGPTHWSGQDLGHAIGLGIVAVLVLTVGVLVALRVCVWLIRSGGSLIKEADVELDGFGRAALAFAGGVGGLASAIGLALTVDRGVGGATLDVGVGVVAAVAAAVIAMRARGPVAIPTGAACLALAGVALAGSPQAGRVEAQAEAIAAGRPWCLVLQHAGRPVVSAAELGFLSLPKGDDHHLVLVVRDDRGEGRPEGAGRGEAERFETAHWSIRQQRFVRGARGGIVSCMPRRDYAKALRAGEIDAAAFAVGPSFYRVPDTLEPIAFLRALSIRDLDVTGSDGIGPRLHHRLYSRVTMRFETRERYLPDDVRPLDALSRLTSTEREAIASGARAVFAGTDRGGRRRSVVECPRGAHAARLCHVEVRIDGSLGWVAYAFYLPLAEIARWSKAADGVVARFAALRVAGP